MPLLIAIETSGPACSVALGDGRTVAERVLLRPREHHALVLPMVAELLAGRGVSRSAIDAIAFGRGPGSFTGVRIATAFAQGLAFSLGRPVIPVSSLDALALCAHELAGSDAAGHLLLAVDAHMGELFCGRYRRAADGVRAEDTDRLVRVADFALPALDPGARVLLAGDAWSAYPLARPAAARWLEAAQSGARHVLALAAAADPGCWIDAAAAEPVYVRGVSAWKRRDEQEAGASTT